MGAILNPIKAHVNGFVYFLFDFSLGKTYSSGVVYMEWGRQLGMSEIGEGDAHGNGLLDVEKSGANFGFGGGGHDIGNNLGKGEDGAIYG